MTKKQAGALGGQQTVRLHGHGYMSKIGKRGAAATWSRYYLAPIGQTEYAMIERGTNKIRCIRGA